MNILTLFLVFQSVPPPVPPPPPPGLPIDGGIVILVIGAILYGSLIIWGHAKKKGVETNNKSNGRYTICVKLSNRQIIDK